MSKCLVCLTEIPDDYAFCSELHEHVYQTYGNLFDAFNAETEGFVKPDDEPVPVDAARAVDEGIEYDRQYKILRDALLHSRKAKHQNIRIEWRRAEQERVAAMPSPKPPDIPRYVVYGLILLVPILAGGTLLAMILEGYRSVMRFLGYVP